MESRAAAACEEDNARLMRTNGSTTSAPLPAFAGLALVALSWMSMQAAQLAALSLGLGLRSILFAGELALAAPGLLALLLVRPSVTRVLSLARPDLRLVLLAAGSGFAFWVGALGLFAIQQAVAPPPPWFLDLFVRLHGVLRPVGPFDAIVSLAAIAIAPGLCEELLFRGVVLPSFLKALGRTGAVIAAAVLFGLIHVDVSPAREMTLYRVPFTLCAGLGLGLLRVRAGTLWAPLVAHATLNAITFALAPLAGDPSEGLGEPRPGMGVALLAAGVAGFAMLLRYLPASGPQGPEVPPTKSPRTGTREIR